MSIDSVLVAVENLRSLIEKWGVSNEALWVAGAAALVLLFFSLREVLTWFLKIQNLAEEMRSLRREVKDLKKFMEVAREVHEIAMNQKTDSSTEAMIAPIAEEEGKTPGRRFPFDN
jgi:hypothetical protein